MRPSAPIRLPRPTLSQDARGCGQASFRRGQYCRFHQKKNPTPSTLEPVVLAGLQHHADTGGEVEPETGFACEDDLAMNQQQCVIV